MNDQCMRLIRAGGADIASLPEERWPMAAQHPGALLQAELAFEHAIARSRELALFRRNAATWELLLLIAEAPDGPDCGVHGLVQAVQARGLGPSALLRFLRERGADGQLGLTPDPAKRSRQRISLRPDLAQTLYDALAQRQRAGLG